MIIYWKVIIRFLGEMETWMVEVVGGVAKCQICRKVVVRGIYCTCDPTVGWHKHCMGKQVKANVETVCKKCKTIVHLEQGMVGTQQMNRKRKGVNGDEEMDVESQHVNKEAERDEDEEERAQTTEEEEPGEGSSKDKGKPKRRTRRRINVASDSE